MWLLHSRLAGHFVLGNYWVVALEVEATVFSPERWEGVTEDVDLVQLVRLCMIMKTEPQYLEQVPRNNRIVSAGIAVLICRVPIQARGNSEFSALPLFHSTLSSSLYCLVGRKMSLLFILSRCCPSPNYRCIR